MPSIKLILDRPKKDATCALVFHIIHDRKHRIVRSGINIKPAQWNGSIIINTPKQAQLNNILLKQKSRVDDILMACILHPVSINTLTDSIKKALNQNTQQVTLASFTEKMYYDFITTNRDGNASAYQTAIKEFIKFNGGDVLTNKEKVNINKREVDSFFKFSGGDIYFSELDYIKLNAFKLHHLAAGHKPNTIGAYLRCIRAIYNEAIKHGIIKKELYPFVKGLIPSAQKTKKKAISKSVIDMLELHRNNFKGNMKLAIDFRLLQFYFRGMDFVDLAMLTTEYVVDGYVEYARYKNRNKDNPTFGRIKIISKAQVILNDYIGSKHLLPLFDTIDINSAAQRANKRKSIDQSMNYVCSKIGIDKDLRSKVIRHTWITIANTLTTKYDLVQHAALHAVPGQTDTYIKYQQSDVDDLNDRVCNNIKLKIERNAKSA